MERFLSLGGKVLKIFPSLARINRKLLQKETKIPDLAAGNGRNTARTVKTFQFEIFYCVSGIESDGDFSFLFLFL